MLRVAPGPDKPVVYNDYRHLLYPLPLAALLIVLRHILEKYWFAPFGKTLGIKNTRTRKVPDNPELEVAYQTSPKIKHEQICALAKQLDMSERQVERWWRLRRSQDKPSTLVKFCENMWRFTYYLYNVPFGAFVLWDKDWLWDIDYCYIGYPNQGLTTDVWWYFMISSAFYWSLTLTQFSDVRRKDFWETFGHHLATIILISFCLSCNLHRIGTLVVLSHECSEIFLDAAKASKYARCQKFCDSVFAVFTLVWIVTRLGIFPFYIIWSAMFRAPVLLTMIPAIYICTALLCMLQALHIMWTWLILQVAYKALKAGQMEGDIRSSSSEVSENDSSQFSKTPNTASSTLSRAKDIDIYDAAAPRSSHRTLNRPLSTEG